MPATESWRALAELALGFVLVMSVASMPLIAYVLRTFVRRTSETDDGEGMQD